MDMQLELDGLTDLQIFRRIDDEAAETVYGALQNQSYSAGSRILHEGDSVQALWIILEGQCLVSRACSDDHEQPLAVLTPGDVFGEMSFIRSAPHSASIVAVTDVVACTYDRNDYLKLAEVYPESAWHISTNIAAVLAERLRRMDNWVCDRFENLAEAAQRDEWQSFRSAVYTNWNF